jgi:hypothetical protein
VFTTPFPHSGMNDAFKPRARPTLGSEALAGSDRPELGGYDEIPRRPTRSIPQHAGKKRIIIIIVITLIITRNTKPSHTHIV